MLESLEAKNILGNFKISEGVVSKIAITAAKEIPEVACMGNFSISIKNIISKDFLQKSVRIKFNENAISIDLCIKVLLGSNLKEVAQKVQKNVKEAVQNMTNLVVSRVNVTISGVVLEKEKCYCNANNSDKASEENSNNEKEGTKE